MPLFLVYYYTEIDFTENLFSMEVALMFVARTEDLAKLSAAMKKSGHASLVYGKRRVGKTRLIKEALKGQDKTALYYECIKGTVKENVDAFVKVLLAEQVLPFPASFDSFQDVFAFLNSLPREFIVVIDEYPYLSTFAEPQGIDSIFQSIIDDRLRNISLVLSGSQISVMKNLLEEKDALYGRFGLILHLQELSYRDAAAFYPSKTPYEKIAFYSMFGGSPFVLRELRDEESLSQNIIRTILTPSSPVNLYAANLLLSDYSNAMNAERILAALGNGKKRYSELESKLYSSSTGNLAKQLKSLIAMELVRQTAPINRLSDAKKKYYEINDNLLRFYYTYLYPNKSALPMIGEQAFFEQIVAPTLLTDFVPRRFEEICRSFFSGLAQAGRLPGITNIGTYYYDDPVRRRNGEFDVALAFGDAYEIYEAKYNAAPLTLDEIHREAGQVRQISNLNVVRLGFVAVNGYEGQEPSYICYNGEDLYRSWT